MDEARQQMAELEKMMDQLKNAHIMTQEEMREQRKQARTGRQQMGAVQDLVQRETGLLDHSQKRGTEPSPALPHDASPLAQHAPPPWHPDEPAPAPVQARLPRHSPIPRRPGRRMLAPNVRCTARSTH